MEAAQTLLTADELLTFPDDGYRYELVAGILKQMTPAGGLHGVITGRLHGLLFEYLQQHAALGILCAAETGFYISRSPDTVRAPDVAFIRQSRIPAEGIPDGFWPFAPDLAVEVLSPGDTYDEVQTKVTAWLAAGTKIVWVVSPVRHTITVHTSPSEAHTLAEGDVLKAEDCLPGFECPVAAIFT